MSNTPTWFSTRGVPTSTEALANHITAEGIRSLGAETSVWFTNLASNRHGQPVVRPASAPVPFP